MEYYRYTRDEAFAREHAYPVIREAVEFFTGYVFEGEDGRYLSGPSISPENAYIKEGEKRFFSNGCTYEILMIRELIIIHIQRPVVQRAKIQEGIINNIILKRIN